MPTCWFSTTFSPDRPAKRPVGAVALPPGKGAVASSRRLRALPRKTQPSSAERHRASRAGRLRPERPYGSQLFSLPPTYKPPTEKVRPCAHPPRRSAPGRIGRRFYESQLTLPQARPRSPHGGPMLAEAPQNCSSHAFIRAQPSQRDGRPTPPPGGEPQRSLRSLPTSAGVGLFPKTVTVRAPAKSYSNAEHAFERFRYLRRGARDLRGLASGRPGRLLRQREPQQNTQWVRRGGAPTGRFTGHPGEKTPRTKNLSQPQTNPISSPPHTARNGS